MNVTWTRAVVMTAGALASSCGADTPAPVELAFDPSGYVVEWSHDCRTVTCSGSGTDTFAPDDIAGVDCDWNCALYDGALLRVHARFMFDANGCFTDPVITTKGCE